MYMSKLLGILRDSAVVGVTTLGSAVLLQKWYKATDYYPPDYAFWFFSGVFAYAGIEAIEHLVGSELLDRGHRLPDKS